MKQKCQIFFVDCLFENEVFEDEVMELAVKGDKLVVLFIGRHERVSLVRNNPTIDHVVHCQGETDLNQGVQQVFF